MRLAEGIVIDKEKTFGVLKFSALRREVHINNEDGTVSDEIKERTYDLKSRGQGCMIQVGLPAHFLIFDEYPSFMEMIGKKSTQVMSKLKQIVIYI